MGVNVNGISALMRKIEQLGKMNDQVKSGATNAGAEVIKKRWSGETRAANIKSFRSSNAPIRLKLDLLTGFYCAFLRIRYESSLNRNQESEDNVRWC